MPSGVRESDFIVLDVVSACLLTTVARYVPLTHWLGVGSHLTALPLAAWGGVLIPLHNS